MGKGLVHQESSNGMREEERRGHVEEPPSTCRILGMNPVQFKKEVLSCSPGSGWGQTPTAK